MTYFLTPLTQTQSLLSKKQSLGYINPYSLKQQSFTKTALN